MSAKSKVVLNTTGTGHLRFPGAGQAGLRIGIEYTTVHSLARIFYDLA